MHRQEEETRPRATTEVATEQNAATRVAMQLKVAENREDVEQSATREKKKEATELSKESCTNTSLPYSHRLGKTKQDMHFSKLYSMLSKVQVNLPLLQMIENVPLYAKFFKELCSRKRKLGVHEFFFASEVVNSVLQQNLPPKLKDPGSFNINITIGNGEVVKAMLDLGASINLMPYSVYT